MFLRNYRSTDTFLEVLRFVAPGGEWVGICAGQRERSMVEMYSEIQIMSAFITLIYL